MRSTSFLVAVVAVLIGGQLVFASEPPAGKNPYKGLFAPQAVLVAPPQSSPAPATDLKPRVVCGMTVIPADPKIDPKIQIKREDSQIHYTIRAVPPPVCK